MKRVAVIILFAISLLTVLCFQVFSNPESTLPECFFEGQDRQIQDLTNLCGSGKGKTNSPKGSPAVSTPPTNTTTKSTNNPSNPYNKTRNGVTVNLPSNWKVFPDGSISPTPEILVPSLYDIN